MKKSMCSFVIGAGLLIACPFLVYGEEPDEKPSGLLGGTVETLSNTVKSVGGQAASSTGAVVEKTVKSVGQTVKDTSSFAGDTVKKLSDPVGNKAVTSTLADTGELLEKAVKNTAPVVKTTVKETTKTTEKTTSEVFKAADKTVENLPDVPVVAPVVKEVNKTVQKVTSGVQQTVENMTDAVNETVGTVTDTAEKTVEKTTDAVDKAADLPYLEEENSPAPKPESPANEQPATDATPKPVAPLTQPVKEEAPADNGQLVENTEPVENPQPAESEVAVEKVQVKEAAPVLIEEKASEVPEEHNIQQPAASGRIDIDGFRAALPNMIQQTAVEIEEEESEKGQETAQSTKQPIFPDGQDESRTMATVPAPTNSSPTIASVSFTGHSADLGYGTISPSEMLKASTEKLWYHKNSYAIIQWVHTPLRKPPITTPFLYVA